MLDYKKKYVPHEEHNKADVGQIKQLETKQLLKLQRLPFRVYPAWHEEQFEAEEQLEHPVIAEEQAKQEPPDK